MTRLQYKICTNPAEDAVGYIDVLVFCRESLEVGVWGQWKLIATRRPYCDEILTTHGRRLKALLRSLA